MDEDTCPIECRDGGRCGKPLDEFAPVCRPHGLAITQAYIRATRDRQLPQFDRPSRRDKPDVVYYLRLPGDRVKIGTTRDLRTRVGSLRATLDDVLATEPGGRPLEQLRHRQFAEDRINPRREDFRASDVLMSHVRMLRNHQREAG